MQEISDYLKKHHMALTAYKSYNFQLSNHSSVIARFDISVSRNDYACDVWFEIPVKQLMRTTVEDIVYDRVITQYLIFLKERGYRKTNNS